MKVRTMAEILRERGKLGPYPPSPPAGWGGHEEEERMAKISRHGGATNQHALTPDQAEALSGSTERLEVTFTGGTSSTSPVREIRGEGGPVAVLPEVDEPAARYVRLEGEGDEVVEPLGTGEPVEGVQGVPDGTERTLTVSDYEGWLRQALVDECDRRGLPRTGNKDELAARLVLHDEATTE